MTFTVKTADLKRIAAVFHTTSSDVDHIRNTLASQAAGPKSESVIGDTGAAHDYSSSLDQWGQGLGQLVLSLETMSRKITAAAVYYEQTESGNTVTSGE